MVANANSHAFGYVPQVVREQRKKENCLPIRIKYVHLTECHIIYINKLLVVIVYILKIIYLTTYVLKKFNSIY